MLAAYLPRASSSTIDSESDGDSDDETDPLLEAPQPPPPMPPAEAVEAVEPQGGAETSSLRKHMRLAKAATTKAKGLVAKKLRRWYKAKKTYIISGKYSHFDSRSIVKRVEQRLFKADCELAEARASVVQCRDSYLRLRTLLALYEKMRVSEAVDPSMRVFWERAKRRVLEPVEAPDTRDMWPGQRRNIWEWNEESYGLALSWMLRGINC